MDSPHGAAVGAEEFGLRGPRGWAFRGVSVQAGPGSLIAIEGPSGSGRTCLLLALTGRMKPAEGHAEVGGLRLPRKLAAVRRIAALGPVPGVSDLDPALTVDEHLRERALLQRRFDGSLRTLLRPRAERTAAARSRIEAALDLAGLDLDALPKAGRTAVRDLERLEALRLSVALALIGRPRLLALDDTDLKLSDADRAEAWELLRGVAANGTTVLAVCSEAPQDAVVIRTGRNAAEAAGTPAKPGPTAKPTEPAEPAAGKPADPVKPEVEKPADPAEPEAEKPADPAEPAESTEPTGDTEPAGNTESAGDTEPAENTEPSTDTPAATTHEDDTKEGAADALAETGRA